MSWFMKDSTVFLSLLVCASLRALGQQCPKAASDGPSVPSETRTLQGELIYHNGIRQWYELKLDKPECGQPSIELVRTDEKWASLEILRGCRVQAKGALDYSSTGYYSLDEFQNVTGIQPIGACARKAPLPVASKAKPDKSVQKYQVEMDVDYEPGDHPIIFHVTSDGKELRPWQAYASYWLTGGFVLYGDCSEGFAVDRVFGPPQANPQHFTAADDPSDQAAFDPESAAAAGVKHLQLGYTCVRAPTPPDVK